MKYFTGIGSRTTPEKIQNQIRLIAQLLGSEDYILRSGGASGADTAFSQGYHTCNFPKEIYIPWKSFNGSDSDLIGASPEALELAAAVHPAWNKCSPAAKLLHGRNAHQVLGADLKTPSEFVICWTKEGKVSGGTATAINIALNHTIPVYNLGRFYVSDLFKGFKFETLMWENSKELFKNRKHFVISFEHLKPTISTNVMELE